MPVDNDNEEIITLNVESGDESGNEPVDRGDDFQPGAEEAPVDAPVDLDALKAVAQEEPKVEDEPEHKTEARIPKARFDEVNARMKQAEAEKQALEEQLRALRGQAPQAKAEQAPQAGQFDLDTAESAYLEALRQGDAQAARQIRGAINSHIQQQAENAAIEKVTATLSKRETETSLVAIANESIKKYPFLNTESDDANDAAISDVVEWRDYYASKGMRADVALQKAVDKIAPMYAKPAPKEPRTEPKVDERAKEAIQRNALAAAAQPMQLNGVGERASKARYDVSKMTEDEFDALPASEKKRLRGDA